MKSQILAQPSALNGDPHPFGLRHRSPSRPFDTSGRTGKIVGLASFRSLSKLIALGVVNTWTVSAFAHEGHGLNGPHWHASDVWALVALAAAVGVAIYLSKGKK